jgi:hypothetical protein
MDEWARRLSAIIRKYKPSKSGASFRNDYLALASDAHRADLITKEDVDLLLRARTYLEGWTSRPPVNSVAAYGQWKSVYDSGRDRLPALVLEALLSRLPKIPRGEIDWAQLVLGDTEKRLLTLVIERRLVSVPELRRLAKARPSEFYRSAALDVLLERGTVCPRPVWEELTKGEPRPADLLGPYEAVVRSFAIDRKADATKWLIGFLADSPAVRSPVLTTLLENRDAAFRLSMHLVVEYSTLGGVTRRKPEAATAADVLQTWVSVCESSLEDDGTSAPTASVVLGLLRLCAIADPSSLPAKTLAALPTASGTVTERAILVALQRAESETVSSTRGFAFVVRGVELYRAVQEYLRRLPVAAGGGRESPERALRFERHMARKEVIQGLISVLQEVADKGALRDAIEVVLFNTGVREYGDRGQEVAFDVHWHEPETGGVLPGDPVVVTRVGRRLGGEEDGIVLIKAMVKPKP